MAKTIGHLFFSILSSSQFICIFIQHMHLSFAAWIIQTENKRYQYCKHLCIISSVSVNTHSSKKDLHSSQGWRLPKYVQSSYFYLPEKEKLKAVVHKVNANCAMKNAHAGGSGYLQGKGQKQCKQHYPETWGRKSFLPVHNPLHLSEIQPWILQSMYSFFQLKTAVISATQTVLCCFVSKIYCLTNNIKKPHHRNNINYWQHTDPQGMYAIQKLLIFSTLL